MQAYRERFKQVLEKTDSVLSQAASLTRFQVAVIIILLFMIALGCGISLLRSRPRKMEVAPAPGAGATKSRNLTVHVAGGVVCPGLYRLKEGSRIAEAVDEAGGPIPGASLDQLNLAQRVKDGEKVFVPTPQPETSTPGAASLQAGPGVANGGLVNINTANEAELDTLPGVGPALAARIIEYRRRKGPFSSIDELDDVEGIGPSKLGSIKELVTI